MMTKNTFVWFVTCCAVLSANAAQSGATNGVIPGVVVRTTVSDPESDYGLRGATLSGNGTKAELIMAAWPKGRRSESESIIWATVDSSGRVSSKQNAFGTLSPAAATSLIGHVPASGIGFVFARNRELLLLPKANGGLRLVQLARSDKPALIRDVNIEGRSLIVRRVVAKNNDHFVLLGNVGAQPVIVTVDIDGKTIMEHTLQEEGMTIVSALFEPDGNTLIVGQQGTSINPIAWIGRVSSRGEVLTKTTFTGRPTDIARGHDGNYVVLIERGSADGSEILMRSLAIDLSEQWTRSLVNRQKLVIPFRLAPVGTGGFIVAGIKDRGLWLSRVKSDGAEMWTEAHDPLASPELEMVSQVELASTQDVFVAAYTAFVVVGREQREVVRAIRFIVN